MMLEIVVGSEICSLFEKNFILEHFSNANYSEFFDKPVKQCGHVNCDDTVEFGTDSRRFWNKKS